MQKKKMAMVSTWKELCGIAYYAECLKKTLESEYEITPFPIPRNIFMIHNPGKKEVQLADSIIQDICSNLSSYDVVNIQFEPGIFGTNILDVFRRIKMLVQASNQVVFTFHSTYRSIIFNKRNVIKALLKLRIGEVVMYARYHYENKKWGKFIQWIDRKAREKKISIVAHSKKESFFLKMQFNNIPVYDVPLIYMSRDERANLENSVKKGTKLTELSFLNNNIKSNTRYIGVFGFISEYKGYLTALKALSRLPSEYEILIFGSVHEGALHMGMEIHPYVDKMVKFVESEDSLKSKDTKDTKIIEESKASKFSDRVHFIGSMSDDDMLYGMMLCDAVIFPYINNSQMASGPISQAIELNRYVLASRNMAFIELNKYYPEKLNFCDIGNYIEIAQKIKESREQIKNEKIVSGMRWIYFEEKLGSLYPDFTQEIYRKAINRELT